MVVCFCWLWDLLDMKHRNPEMGAEPGSCISLKLEKKKDDKNQCDPEIKLVGGGAVRQVLGELTWPKLAEAVSAVERNVVLANTVKASEVTSH